MTFPLPGNQGARVGATSTTGRRLVVCGLSEALKWIRFLRICDASSSITASTRAWQDSMLMENRWLAIKPTEAGLEQRRDPILGVFDFLGVAAELPIHLAHLRGVDNDLVLFGPAKGTLKGSKITVDCFTLHALAPAHVDEVPDAGTGAGPPSRRSPGNSIARGAGGWRFRAGAAVRVDDRNPGPRAADLIEGGAQPWRHRDRAVAWARRSGVGDYITRVAWRPLILRHLKLAHSRGALWSPGSKWPGRRNPKRRAAGVNMRFRGTVRYPLPRRLQ